MYKKLTIRIVFLLCCLFVLTIAMPQKGMCIAHKVIGEGGPYVCKSTNKLQKFSASVAIPSDQEGSPLWITFYNGYGRRSGYSWVRVFLGDPGQTELGGHLLANERTFVQRRAITVNVSGRITSKPRMIFVEGEGTKGAIFSWVLTSVKSNLSILNTTSFARGKTTLIHGTGFSTDALENKVLINGQQVPVISATSRILKVKVPKNLKGKNASLQVQVKGSTSNNLSVAMGLLPPTLISMSPYGGPVGGVLNIRGANFSRMASNNIVHIGSYIAPVIKVMDTGTLLCRIPNWGGCGGTLPVSITVNGVPSRDHLRFWCVSHYYGGNPNAEIYSYD